MADSDSSLAQMQTARSALAVPPRPVSPAWAPLTLLLLIGFVGSALATPSPTLDVASRSTTTTTSIPTSGTSHQQQTTTSTAPTTTATGPQFPRVASAAVIFAPISAGESGDPNTQLVSGAEVVTVDSITDGDTIQVELADGTIEPLRLIGINTPEKNECWAPEATLALANMIPVGTEVGITVDVSDRDQFDRLLRYIWVGTFSINEEMIRRGAAISRRYPPDTALADRFEVAQVAAQENRLGLWAPDACGPPADAALTIVSLFYDAPGNDNENLNEEWIRIRNDGDNLVDMTGWGIKDESASNRYEFPVGFVLAAGEYVTVYSGCGSDFGLDLYWCSVGSAIWNNDGDTAFLTDPNGNTHTSKTYAPTTTTQSPTTTAVKSVAPTTAGGSGCHPSYTGQCVPVGVSDVDCAGGSGDGPEYTGRVTVVGPDDYKLDNDGDGIGCNTS
ncbi:MAG TPA: lamin tail domain-containing protein [Acidimicrobiia bacterium]